jgi:sarcosine oxidase subunit beta
VTTIVVVGGGLVGLSAAWHARRADPTARVTVLERAATGAGASGASAAGVRAMGRDPAERPLALASLARWPDLDRELDGSTGYRRGGGLRVAESGAELAQARADVAAQCADGVPVEVVDARQTREIAAGLSPAVLGGIHCPIDGQADALATVQAFAAAARRLGARIDEGAAVASILAERGRVVGVALLDGTRVPGDVVIVTAGAWTAKLLGSVGVPVPLTARGLQMLLTDPGPPSLAAVVSRVGGQLSLKQLADGRYLIGGGWPGEIPGDSASRGRILGDSVSGSFTLARSVYTPLECRAVAQSWVGIEAFMPDGLPILGPLGDVKGLLVAAGFSGHGFALAPIVGDILSRLALGQDPLADLWKGLADRTRGVRGDVAERSGQPGPASVLRNDRQARR